MPEPDHIAAHIHSIHNREQLLASDTCGCFYCLKVFAPDVITDWIDEPGFEIQTAQCPYCEIDSVVGSASGFPITREFLACMRRHWF